MIFDSILPFDEGRFVENQAWARVSWKTGGTNFLRGWFCCAIRSCPSGWADANFLLAEVGDAIVVEHIEGEWLWVRTEDGHKGWFPRHAVVHPPIKIEY